MKTSFINKVWIFVCYVMVKVQDVYPLETVIRIRKTGQFAIIKNRSFLNGENFLNYLAIIEGRGEGLY